MKESTQEIISRLYAIRSMLSAISLKHDRVDKLKEQKEKKEKENLPRPKPKPLIDIKKRKKELAEKIKKKKAEQNALHFLDVLSLRGRLIMLFFVALSRFLGFVWVHMDYSTGFGFLFWPIAILTGLCFLGILIVPDLSWLNRNKYKTDKQKNKQLTSEIEQLHNSLCNHMYGKKKTTT